MQWQERQSQQQQRPHYGQGAPEDNFSQEAVYSDPRAQLTSGVNRFMAGVFGWMGAGMAVTATVILLLTTVGSTSIMPLFYPIEGGMTGLGMMVSFAPLLFVLFVSRRMETMSPANAKLSFMFFAGLFGLSLAYLPQYYNLPSLLGTFLVTTLMYGSIAAYGYFTKKDLSAWGNFLFMALIGMIFALFASMLFGLDTFLLSALFVLLFAGLTAYETQSIKQMYLVQGSRGNLAIMGALSLYITFVNMFLWILRLFGGRR